MKPAETDGTRNLPPFTAKKVFTVVCLQNRNARCTRKDDLALENDPKSYGNHHTSWLEVFHGYMIHTIIRAYVTYRTSRFTGGSMSKFVIEQWPNGSPLSFS